MNLLRCLRQLPAAADQVGMLRIHRASGGGGGSAQAKEGMVGLLRRFGT